MIRWWVEANGLRITIHQSESEFVEARAGLAMIKCRLRGVSGAAEWSALSGCTDPAAANSRTSSSLASQEQV